MSNSQLPARPSLEFLRKLAKDRLADMRRTDPDAQLATALLAVAHDHGFSSWRALKAEIDSRHATQDEAWFAAVKKSDVDAVRAFVRKDPGSIDRRDAPHDATALHFAATCGATEIVRLLLDAGADPQARDESGLGVLHWMTFHRPPGDVPADTLSLLLERGARHDIFSAIALGDPGVVRAVGEQDPEALDCRLSRRHHGQTPLHFAIARARLDLLPLLIDLGADVAATDHNGQTPLEFAMLRNDGAAIAALRAAGAPAPKPASASNARATVADLARSVQTATPVVGTRDASRTLEWYASIGFTEVGRYPTDGTTVFWGMVTLGKAELTFDVREAAPARGVSLLLVIDHVTEFYECLKSRQLETADVEFVETLHEPEHGGLEFSVRDPNGFTLRFLQQAN